MTSCRAGGELGCFTGRGSRDDAAGKGSCAEAGWDVLLAGGEIGAGKQGLEEVCASLC